MKNRIISFLEMQDSAVDSETIARSLNLKSSSEYDEMVKALKSLEQELIVYFTNKHKYMLYSKAPNFRIGRIEVNRKGFGFVTVEGEENNDIHISADKLNYALDGDKVLVELLGEAKKREGKVLKVIDRNIKNIVGSIKRHGTELFFEPKEKKNFELTIDADSFASCVEGEIVVATIIDDLGKNNFIGKITQHICHKDDPREDILEVAAKYDIYSNFSEEAMEQAEEMPNEVLESEYAGRVDLTDEMIFTIDGADTKDIDDAISLKMVDGYYELGVHIADVSHYVTENSPLDLEAQRRGTSSYLADSVIPMLPHKLSNGICSLNEGVPRLALSFIMKIDSRGKIVDSRIQKSVIKSRKKMTYKAVNDIIERDIVEPGYEEFVETLKEMNVLAHIIRDDRTRRGASDFDIDEAKIICDENGKCIDVKKRTRGEGERLIEDFMIAANETVARTVESLGYPGVYRVHDVPKPEKISKFIAFCNNTGCKIKGKFENMNPKIFQKLLAQVKVPEEVQSIYKSLAVRSMPKAFYDFVNIGHFGLASKSYAHSTSPIRRYPDLLIHRLVKKYLFSHEIDEKVINYYEANLPGLTKLCSDRENKAVEAEREVEKMKFAEYMTAHVGEEFQNAIISGVKNIGFFVQLDNLIEGLVPVQSIDGDYFELDEDNQCLVGRSTGIRYRIGDRISVKCVGANKEERTIDFEISRVNKKENDDDLSKERSRKLA